MLEFTTQEEFLELKPAGIQAPKIHCRVNWIMYIHISSKNNTYSRITLNDTPELWTTSL